MKFSELFLRLVFELIRNIIFPSNKPKQFATSYINFIRVIIIFKLFDFCICVGGGGYQS